MRKIHGRKITIILPDDLLNRIDEQAKKENRTQSEFIRRALDRYLLEQEFRGEVNRDAAISIKKNKELLKLLKDA